MLTHPNFDPETSRYFKALQRALWNLDLAIDIYSARYNGIGDPGPVRTAWGIDPGGTAAASAVKPHPSAPTSPRAVLLVQLLLALEEASTAIVYGTPEEAARAVAGLYDLFDRLATCFEPGAFDICFLARLILDRLNGIQAAAGAHSKDDPAC